VLAVSGNADDNLDREGKNLLPEYRLTHQAGWKILLVHIVAPGPQAKGGLAAGCSPAVTMLLGDRNLHGKFDLQNGEDGHPHGRDGSVAANFPAVLHVAFLGLCCLYPAVLPSVLCTRRLL